MRHFHSAEDLSAIQQFDACTILNAIETAQVRLRSEGFAGPGLHWQFASPKSMIGYASTLKVKSDSTRVLGQIYADRTDWWRDIEQFSGPVIAVIEDSSEAVGAAAVAGEVHAAIMQRLGCAGMVTNGSVRDLEKVDRLGFSFLSGSVCPSHGYEHIVQHNGPVEINGLKIQPGDLLYADRHGLISIPHSLVPSLPGIAKVLEEDDLRVVAFCHSSLEFSFARLEEIIYTVRSVAQAGSGPFAW